MGKKRGRRHELLADGHGTGPLLYLFDQLAVSDDSDGEDSHYVVKGDAGCRRSFWLGVLEGKHAPPSVREMLWWMDVDPECAQLIKQVKSYHQMLPKRHEAFWEDVSIHRD